MIRKPGTITVEVEDHREYGRVVVVGGEIDTRTVPVLAQTLERVVAERPSRVLVDLSEVSFMDAAGLTALCSANNQAWPETVFVVIAYGAAARPLQLTGLATEIAVYPNRVMALAGTIA
ncbi:STAS domain-containing protein [Nocardia sp. NPDC050712]|uniref:STAS domain-containing protein n=1 Tax=Nocardia sp. NPDC050712 TaxID=3155518 RepID=UPI0033FDBE2B